MPISNIRIKLKNSNHVNVNFIMCVIFKIAEFHSNQTFKLYDEILKRANYI